MPVFTIQAPDGRKIRVEATDEATALKGAQSWAASSAKPAAPRTQAQRDAKRRVANTPDRVRALTKGFSFGFADEVDAAGAALETGANNLARRVTGQPSVGYGMVEAYGAVLDANQQADAEFAKQHPVQNVALQIAGGAVGPGAARGARYIGGARSFGAATARSAAVGAGMGAVSGAGNANGGTRERARGAVEGAVTGAAVGAAMPAAARAMQTAGRTANAALGQPFGGANRGAVARLREALHQDGLSPAQIAQTVDQWRRSGVTPEFLNVVGENTRALIRASSGQQGAARNAAQAYRDRTVASIPNRAIERANQLTPGETRTPTQFAQEMTTARDTAANRNYGQWADAQVTVPDEIKDMLADPAGLRIVREAMEDAVALQDWPRQRELQQLLQPTRNGQLARISAGTVERLRMAARDQAGDFAAHGRNPRAVGFGQRQQQLDSVIGAIPEAAPARAQYAAQSQAIEAAQGGPSVLGPRPEFQAGYGEIASNPDAVRAARIRERQGLRDYFGTRDQVRARLADIANAPDVRPNLEQLYGGRGGQFADAARYLVQKQDNANFIAPNTGSQTQLRGRDAQNAFGLVANVMEAMGGRIRPLIERAARGLTMTEREREILVQLGIGSPEDAARALAAPPPASTRVTSGAARRAAVAASPAAVSGPADR